MKKIFSTAVLFLLFALSSFSVSAKSLSTGLSSDYGIVGYNQEAGFSMGVHLNYLPLGLNTELRYAGWGESLPTIADSKETLVMTLGYDLFNSPSMFSSLGFGVGAGTSNYGGYDQFYTVQFMYGLRFAQDFVLYNRNMMGFGEHELSTGAVTIGLMWDVD